MAEALLPSSSGSSDSAGRLPPTFRYYRKNFHKLLREQAPLPSSSFVPAKPVPSSQHNHSQRHGTNGTTINQEADAEALPTTFFPSQMLSDAASPFPMGARRTPPLDALVRAHRPAPTLIPVNRPVISDSPGDQATTHHPSSLTSSTRGSRRRRRQQARGSSGQGVYSLAARKGALRKAAKSPSIASLVELGTLASHSPAASRPTPSSSGSPPVSWSGSGLAVPRDAVGIDMASTYASPLTTTTTTVTNSSRSSDQVVVQEQPVLAESQDNAPSRRRRSRRRRSRRRSSASARAVSTSARSNAMATAQQQLQQRNIPTRTKSLTLVPSSDARGSGSSERGSTSSAMAPLPQRQLSRYARQVLSDSALSDKWRVERPAHCDTSAYRKCERRVTTIHAGPVLFTAPHGLYLVEPRVHKPELHVNQIVARLARLCDGSSITWNLTKARAKEAMNLDPNYLTAEQFEHSPWHWALRDHLHRCTAMGWTPFHVDVHGKWGRPTHVDIGIRGMHVLWPDTKFAAELHGALHKELSAALSGTRWSVEADPYLDGYWGDPVNGWDKKGRRRCGRHTLSTQSIMLGMPAVQLELLDEFRTEMTRNKKLMSAFAQAITNVYLTVVKDYDVSRIGPRVPRYVPATGLQRPSRKHKKKWRGMRRFFV